MVNRVPKQLHRISMAVALTAWTVLTPELAMATAASPPKIKEILSLAEAPDCSLCHQGGKTGSSTVTTPFVQSLKSRGFSPKTSSNSLATAIAALDAEKTDSDGDGMPDIQELEEGRDPNTPEGGAGPNGENNNFVPPPAYGCRMDGGRLSSGFCSETATPLSLISLLLATVHVRRRRRA